MGPTAKLVTGSAVIGDFLDSVAIADPVEVSAPDVWGDAGEGPTTAGDFADKGVVVSFGRRASPGARVCGLEAGGCKGGVKSDGGGFAWLEESSGGYSCFRVLGLHEYE